MSLAPSVVVGASGQVLVRFDPVPAPGAVEIDRRNAAGRDAVLVLEGGQPRDATPEARRRRAWRKAGLCGSCGGAGLFACAAAARCGTAAGTASGRTGAAAGRSAKGAAGARN